MRIFLVFFFVLQCLCAAQAQSPVRCHAVFHQNFPRSQEFALLDNRLGEFLGQKINLDTLALFFVLGRSTREFGSDRLANFISDSLGISYIAGMRHIRDLRELGMIESLTHKSDARRKTLQLSANGKQSLERFLMEKGIRPEAFESYLSFRMERWLDQTQNANLEVFLFVNKILKENPDVRVSKMTSEISFMTDVSFPTIQRILKDFESKDLIKLEIDLLDARARKVTLGKEGLRLLDELELTLRTSPSTL